jgi:D-alanyl-D-alanine dipeptidase
VLGHEAKITTIMRAKDTFFQSTAKNFLFWAMMFSVLAGNVGLAAGRLPKGFVYLRDVDSSIRQDIRYAGSHNFLGRPVDGYRASECILTEPAAVALKKAQEKLADRQLSLVAWDCYRPARAVRDFLHWTMGPDQLMKGEFFPRTEKTQLVPLGYIAARSRHSLGGAVDVGIVAIGLKFVEPPTPANFASCALPKGDRFEDGTIDLGSGYDCFDPVANVGNGEVGKLASENRRLLRDLMVSVGFKPYAGEWWHFELRNAPLEAKFDFEILPR